MKPSFISISLLVIALLLSGCHAKKNLNKTEESPVPAVSEPVWHTCAYYDARATLTMGKQSFDANCTIEAVHDSMVVVSVLPILGIEAVRLEATPKDILLVDKLGRRFVRVTYDEINELVTPAVHYKDLQALAYGDERLRLPGANRQQAAIGFSAKSTQYKGEQLRLIVTYGERRTDIPLRIQRLNLARYQQVSLMSLLQ